MRFLCGVVLFALCLSMQCYSQGTMGSIAGEVRDPAGAAVPNANVTVTDVATNTVRTTQTNSGGIFNVPALNPSTYVVRIQATGFMTHTRTRSEEHTSE